MKSSIVPLLGLSLFLVSCRNEAGKMQENASSADSTSISDDITLSSSAAVQNNEDSVHQFVRTADLKFKVKDVGRSTTAIEDIAVRQGGFVTYTHLASNIDNVTTIPVSIDSSLETTYYNVTNSVVLRVPNANLDTMLKEIARTVDYLDYRIIKADDVALQLLANNLTQQRTRQTQHRLKKAIDRSTSKLGETVNAEEAASQKEEQASQTVLSNRLLADQISFSTVNLNLYQHQTLRRILVFNNKDITAYEPSFARRLLNSFEAGWRMLQTFLLFIAGLWWLILLGIIVYYFFYKPFKQPASRKLS